jgi:hypothetical protein
MVMRKAAREGGFFFFCSIRSEYQVRTSLLPGFGPVTVTNDRLIQKGLVRGRYFGQGVGGLTGFPHCRGKVRNRGDQSSEIRNRKIHT